jgi:hypothetical protein
MTKDLNITVNHYGFKKWRKRFRSLSNGLGAKKSISHWIRNVEKTAKDLDPAMSGTNVANDFRGDCAEMLMEMVFKLMPYDNRLKISKYEVTPKNQFGVDGIGVAHNGKLAAVQIKSSNNPKAYLGMNDHHLGNFTTAACLTHYKVDQNTMAKDGNLLLVHFGKGLLPVPVNQPYLDRVRQLTYRDLQKILNGSTVWEKIEEILLAYSN